MEVLGKISDFGSWLRASGLTVQSLLIVGGLFLLTFAISLRELLTWYFKIGQLQKSIEDLRAAIGHLEHRLNESQVKIPSSQMVASPEPKIFQTKTKPEEKSFPLQIL